MSDRFSSVDYLIKKLFKKINVNLLTVTLGKEGIKTSKKKEEKSNPYHSLDLRLIQ